MSIELEQSPRFGRPESRDYQALSRSSIHSFPSIVQIAEHQSGGGNENQINETIRPIIGVYHRGNTSIEDPLVNENISLQIDNEPAPFRRTSDQNVL